MKSLIVYKTYIAALLMWFGAPYVAQLVKVKLTDIYAILIALAIGFVVDKLIK